MKKYLMEFLCAAAGLAVGASAVYAANYKKLKLAEECAVIDECKEILAEYNVTMNGELDEIALLNGYLDSYDKYTYCYEPDYESKEVVTDFVNGMPTAIGCGFTVEYNENDELVFLNVTQDMPADKQGIKPNDKVISIDGELVSEHEYDFAKELLGKDGTMCSLVLERDGERIELEFERHSGDISELQGVVVRNYGTTLYMSIASVSDNINSFVQKNLNENEFDSLILDLRNNRGGSTSAGMGVADNFISEGYVTEHYYTGEESKSEINSAENDVDVPIVVLVNEHTASAAEIITALLKQNADAEIVGTNTFGKGIFQLTAPLEGGMRLHFTAGKFTVGDWDCWQGVGIAPDYEIEMDSSLIGTENDVQLNKAIELLG